MPSCSSVAEMPPSWSAEISRAVTVQSIVPSALSLRSFDSQTKAPPSQSSSWPGSGRSAASPRKVRHFRLRVRTPSAERFSTVSPTASAEACPAPVKVTRQSPRLTGRKAIAVTKRFSDQRNPEPSSEGRRKGSPTAPAQRRASSRRAATSVPAASETTSQLFSMERSPAASIRSAAWL